MYQFPLSTSFIQHQHPHPWASPDSYLFCLQLFQVLFDNSDLAISAVDVLQQLFLRLLYHIAGLVVWQRRRNCFHLRVVCSRRLLHSTDKLQQSAITVSERKLQKSCRQTDRKCLMYRNTPEANNLPTGNYHLTQKWGCCMNGILGLHDCAHSSSRLYGIVEFNVPLDTL